MVLKITDAQWMNKDDIVSTSINIGGLHLSGGLFVQFIFNSRENDRCEFKLDIVPHTLILDKVGTDYQKVDPKDATMLLSECDVSWVPELIFDYLKVCVDEDSGMNLPSFENWTKEKMTRTSKEDEFGIKERVDRTITSYLDSLENLVKEQVWDK